MSFIDVKYCIKCKGAFDTETDKNLCSKCRGIKVEEEDEIKTI